MYTGPSDENLEEKIEEAAVSRDLQKLTKETLDMVQPPSHNEHWLDEFVGPALPIGTYASEGGRSRLSSVASSVDLNEDHESDKKDHKEIDYIPINYTMFKDFEKKSDVLKYDQKYKNYKDAAINIINHIKYATEAELGEREPEKKKNIIDLCNEMIKLIIELKLITNAFKMDLNYMKKDETNVDTKSNITSLMSKLDAINISLLKLQLLSCIQRLKKETDGFKGKVISKVHSLINVLEKTLTNTQKFNDPDFVDDNIVRIALENMDGKQINSIIQKTETLPEYSDVELDNLLKRFHSVSDRSRKKRFFWSSSNIAVQFGKTSNTRFGNNFFQNQKHTDLIEQITYIHVTTGELFNNDLVLQNAIAILDSEVRSEQMIELFKLCFCKISANEMFFFHVHSYVNKDTDLFNALTNNSEDTSKRIHVYRYMTEIKNMVINLQKEPNKIKKLELNINILIHAISSIMENCETILDYYDAIDETTFLNIKETYKTTIKKINPIHIYVKERCDTLERNPLFDLVLLNEGEDGKIYKELYLEYYDTSKRVGLYKSAPGLMWGKNITQVTDDKENITSETYYSRDLALYELDPEKYKDKKPIRCKTDFKANPAPELLVLKCGQINGYIGPQGNYEKLMEDMFNTMTEKKRNIFLVGFGYSGAGKTSEMFGRQGNVGFVIQFINNNFKKYKKMSLQCQEIYAHDFESGQNFLNVQSDDYLILDGKPYFFHISDKDDWINETNQSLYMTIQEFLLNRITKPTENNIKSSRSHLIIKFAFDGLDQKLIIGDFCGVENSFDQTHKTRLDFLKVINSVHGMSKFFNIFFQFNIWEEPGDAFDKPLYVNRRKDIKTLITKTKKDVKQYYMQNIKTVTHSWVKFLSLCHIDLLLDIYKGRIPFISEGTKKDQQKSYEKMLQEVINISSYEEINKLVKSNIRTSDLDLDVKFSSFYDENSSLEDMIGSFLYDFSSKKGTNLKEKLNDIFLFLGLQLEIEIRNREGMVINKSLYDFNRIISRIMIGGLQTKKKDLSDTIPDISNYLGPLNEGCHNQTNLYEPMIDTYHVLTENNSSIALALKYLGLSEEEIFNRTDLFVFTVVNLSDNNRPGNEYSEKDHFVKDYNDCNLPEKASNIRGSILNNNPLNPRFINTNKLKKCLNISLFLKQVDHIYDQKKIKKIQQALQEYRDQLIKFLKQSFPYIKDDSKIKAFENNPSFLPTTRIMNENDINTTSDVIRFLDAQNNNTLIGTLNFTAFLQFPDKYGLYPVCFFEQKYQAILACDFENPLECLVQYNEVSEEDDSDDEEDKDTDENEEAETF